MSGPLFTVLLPVHRPPVLLPYAIRSVLAQTEQSFELLVVCDGAPDETVACAQAFADADPRIRVFPFPKGERHGEAHRDTVLRQAAGRFVAQIADDDLWFPDNLAEMAALLEQVDFGNLVQPELLLDGSVVAFGDLARPEIRRRLMEEVWNFFGPSCAGYRLAAYRSLPEGWSPAPAGLPTDLYMWRKFLVHPGLSFATRFSVQCVKLSAAARSDMSLEVREAETRSMVERFSRPEARRDFQAMTLASVVLHARHESARRIQELDKRRADLKEELEAARAERDEARQAERGAQSKSARAARSLEELRGYLQVGSAELTAARAELAASQAAHRSVVTSRWWRRTEPLRRLDERLRHLRRKLKGLPPQGSG